ncbi:MAG: hypothetical protein A2066_07215 [Bacteroidetes bacterium GWB2_41_8]|nr:MAG: hypothetical protein A2066_07215 [Bacteroidetes bacterium GWB2_41_8]
MKKHVLALLFLVTVSAFSSLRLQAEEKNNQLIGEWIYQVSDAPYGYEKGSLIFSEKEGKTVCVIKLEAGELEASDLKVEKEKITFTTYVDGNPINVELTRDKNKLTGTVDSPEGPKTLTAEKKEK